MPTFASELVTPYEIDTTNSITQDLVFCAVSNGANIVDLVSGSLASTEVSVTHGSDAGGNYFQTTNGSSRVSFSAEDIQPYNTSDVTIITITEYTAESGLLLLISLGESGNPDIALRGSTSGKAVFRASNYFDGGNTYPNDTNRGYSVSIDSSDNAKLYYDQEVTGPFSTTISGTQSKDINLHMLGDSDPNLSMNAKGYMHLVFNRVLTDAEVFAIHADPYQLFRTAEDELRDYALRGDGVNAHVLVDIPSSAGVGGDYHTYTEIRMKKEDENFFFFDTDYLTDTQVVTVPVGTVTHGVTATDFHTYAWEYKFISGVKTYNFWVDGVQIVTEGSTTGIRVTTTKLMQQSGGDNRKGSIQYVKHIDYYLPENNRYYDCNQANDQGYVPELLQDKHGTLQGFPAAAGYVRELSALVDGVAFDGIDDDGTFTEIDRPETSWRIEMEFRCDESLGAFREVMGRTIDGSAQIELRSQGGGDDNFRYRVGGTNRQLNFPEATFATGRWMTMVLTYDGTTLSGVANGANSTSNWSGSNLTFKQFDVFARNNASGYRACAWRYFRYYNTTSGDELIHDWDFREAEGTLVRDKASGNDVTLNGFTNVYYRPEASNELIGYRFNGDTYLQGANQPSGIYDIEIDFAENLDRIDGTFQYIFQCGNGSLYVRNTDLLQFSGSTGTAGAVNFEIDGVPQSWVSATTPFAGSGLDSLAGKTLRINGAADLNVNLFIMSKIGATEKMGGVISAIRVYAWDTHTLVGSYDGTTGDVDNFVNTVGSGQLNIQSAPTSGFLPVVDRQVFTASDYATLSGFQTAENGNADIREYRPTTTTGATLTGFTDGVIIEGGAVTSPITISTTGDCFINNATLDDVTVSGQTGNTYIENCEAQNVAG